MRQTMMRLLAVGLLLPLLLAVDTSGANAQEAQAVKIRVPITDDGYNGQPSNFVINVEQGQLIELTFVFAQTVNLTDEHIIVLDGYNLETKPINFTDHEGTLRFVADKPGSFRLKCDNDCEIHDKLKNGTLVVARAGSGGPAAAGGGGAGASTKPKSQLSIVAPTEVELGGLASLATTVSDASGAPIAGAHVRLLEELGFLGTKPQEVEVGDGTSDRNGATTLVYAGRRTGARTLKAYFDGGIDHQSTSAALNLEVMDGPPIYRVEPPSGVPGVNRFFVSGIIVAVWGTMFVVALHVVGIARAGARAEDEGAGDE